MKKAIKVILATAALIASAVAIIEGVNKFIFKRSKDKDKNFEEGEYFNWQHGNIHYVKKGKGRPLLLIHGLYVGASHREFCKNINQLSRKYTVYAVDLPGFGYSDKPKITYTAFTYVSFINTFVKEVIGRPCYALGTNGGGMVLAIAAKLEVGNFQQVMLVSPWGINPKMASNRDFYQRTWLELPLKGTTVYNYFASKRKIKEFLEHQGFFDPRFVDEEIIEAMYHSAHATGSYARYAFASLKTNFINMDIQNYFKNLEIPVTVIWGEENIENTVENANILRELKEDIDVFVFEKTKIFPHMENYGYFNRLVKEIL